MDELRRSISNGMSNEKDPSIALIAVSYAKSIEEARRNMLTHPEDSGI